MPCTAQHAHAHTGTRLGARKGWPGELSIFQPCSLPSAGFAQLKKLRISSLKLKMKLSLEIFVSLMFDSIILFVNLSHK